MISEPLQRYLRDRPDFCSDIHVEGGVLWWTQHVGLGPKPASSLCGVLELEATFVRPPHWYITDVDLSFWPSLTTIAGHNAASLSPSEPTAWPDYSDRDKGRYIIGNFTALCLRTLKVRQR